ncbi:uncharacterized protein TM35_000371760 [Trypanosoma theileri]|uniref:VHS domain-containing protein n=1 Tax=Trypanosoma theileri TaxID=67003 RepID=A0A1X0NL79_9TRYP|nr:uncharacterized protein TM35_000371760 [Trypanosoma theileri]ORC85203.1 hypothetical protein TM35_000371760 [Trypanosoma theileri]
MSVQAKLHAALEYVLDSADPYTRLVQRALTADPRTVPFYQLDEVRSASFQSDHACERIVRAIAVPLSVQPPVALNVRKALELLRVLVLEGAAGVRARMPTLRPELHRIAHAHDVRRDTVEAMNKELAAALLLALDGNSESLISLSSIHAGGNREMSGEATSMSTAAGGGGGTSTTLQKSVFQTMHEREQRLYRKQCDEQKKQSVVIVKERVYGSFDGNLSPEKLVEQVILNPKKKFARQELDSFVDAALSTGRLEEVCAELDRQLCEPRQSLQNRYKILLVIEAVVDHNSNHNNNINNNNSGELDEAREFFRRNSSGVCRHMQTTSAENPVKAEAAMGVAQRILQSLQQQKQQQQIPASLPPSMGSSNQFANVPQSASLQIDDLFSDLSLRKTQPMTSTSKSVYSVGQPTVDTLGNLFGSVDSSKPERSMTNGGPSCNITAISSVPRPPEQFYQQQQQQQNKEEVLPNYSVLASVGTTPSNPLISSYSLGENGGMWQPLQQKQQSLGSLSHERIESGGNNGKNELQNQQQQQYSTLASSDSLQRPLGMEGREECQSLSLLDSMKNPQFGESGSNDEKMQLLRQIQSQMEMTKLMLEQQQAAFFALQAELQKK